MSEDCELHETVGAEVEPAASAPDPAPGSFQAEIAGIRDALSVVQSRLGALEEVTGVVAKQVGYLPPQVRQLGAKIETLTVSISESRYRSLLQSLLVIYDLVDQAARTSAVPENDSPRLHRQNYEVLRTQLSQILTVNGLSLIPADGPFDPSVHRAVERVPVDDASRANQIVELVRPGFRTGQGVLRYAEVRVGYRAPAEPVETTEETAAGTTPVQPGNRQ